MKYIIIQQNIFSNEYTQYCDHIVDIEEIFGDEAYKSIVIDLIHKRITYDGITWSDINE